MLVDAESEVATEVHVTHDSAATIGLLIEALARSGQPVSALAAELPALRMIKEKVPGVDYYVLNTDAQHLYRCEGHTTDHHRQQEARREDGRQPGPDGSRRQEGATADRPGADLDLIAGVFRRRLSHLGMRAEFYYARFAAAEASARAREFGGNFGDDRFDVLLTIGARFLEPAGNASVLGRLQVTKRQVFELPLDLRQSETVSEGRIDLQRFLSRCNLAIRQGYLSQQPVGG